MGNVGGGQISIRLSLEESETAINALSYGIKDGFHTLDHGLTDSWEKAISDIDRIASLIEKGRALLSKLSSHLDDPTKDLELSDAELEWLGNALYAYGVFGFHRALCAVHGKSGFANDETESRAIDTLNQQNERAFALFKRLEQHKRNVLWMVWPQANMEHKFAPAR